MSTDLSSFTFCAARFPPLDSSFIVLGDVTPTYKEKKGQNSENLRQTPVKHCCDIRIHGSRSEIALRTCR